MSYYRYCVTGGEYVVCSDHGWRISFNGVQIGGVFDTPLAAIRAVDRRRAALLAGPDLTDVPDPPQDPLAWSQQYPPPAPDETASRA